MSVHWRKGNREDGKAPALQGLYSSPCHSSVYVPGWMHLWDVRSREATLRTEMGEEASQFMGSALLTRISL